MKMHQFQQALLTLLLSVLAATVTVTAKAQLTCSTWHSGGSTSQSIYNCNFLNGSFGGSYGTSYSCYENSFNDNCTINYTGGNSYEGDCTVVFQCYNGSSYYCNINNWNGKDYIQCDNVPLGCKDVYVCKDTRGSPVPEPPTILAGALLLIPLGISTARMLRKHKAVSHI